MNYARYFTLLILFTCLSGLFAARVWDASASRKHYDPAPRLAYEAARADSATGFDVQKYVITLNISQSPNFISGNVLATVLAEDNLPSISYELVGLNVTEVRVNGQVSTYTHAGGLLTIPVFANANDSFQTQVFYSGTPQLSGNAYNVGMYFQPNSIFTISDPDAARFWWPCYDHPWDKAVVDLIISLRSDWKVAANGLRESIVEHGDGTATTTWRGWHPMTTYLVCITAGPYVEIAQTALNGNLPILNFVTQNQAANALIDLANLPEMIDYYSGLFGPYPFEKYGNATVSMSTFGAMEHQTMTTLGNYIITGNHTHELTIAHELVHQWYGNAVSFLDFKDVWLSEGFATYGEHLWVDHVDGWQAACDYVLSSYHQYYKNWENSYGAATIYDPAFTSYFSPPSYEKAASVLHMLRLKLGDDLFFQLLQQWFSSYRDGNVITSEFQAMAEGISGLDLQQFFQQWIFGKGIPSVRYRVMHKPATQELKVFAQSSSPTTTSFEVDLPFKLFNSSGSDSLLVKATPEGYANLYDDISTFDSLTANHNNWTLLQSVEEEAPRLIGAFPIPWGISVHWQGFSEAVNYKIYYREQGASTWTVVNEYWPCTQTHHSIVQLLNYQPYEVMIKAIDAEGFMSVESNILTATPRNFAFDNRLLVVDETRDGTGANISPTDAMVDDFYAAALWEYNFDEWDVANLGLPAIENLSLYRAILWHADDFSQNLAQDAEDVICNYLIGGGQMIFSGWRSAGTFSPEFWQIIAPEDPIEVFYDNAACLISASGLWWPDLVVDQSKLAATWNGMLPMINTFETTAEGLFIAQMPDGFNGTGRKAAIDLDRIFIYGFPLYFMEAEGVQEAVTRMMNRIVISTEDEQIPAAQMTLNVAPNPFNPSTKLQFSMPQAAKASLKLYNMKGQLLQVLHEGLLAKGNHSYTLELPNLPSAIYIISFEAAGKRLHKRISLLK